MFRPSLIARGGGSRPLKYMLILSCTSKGAFEILIWISPKCIQFYWTKFQVLILPYKARGCMKFSTLIKVHLKEKLYWTNIRSNNSVTPNIRSKNYISPFIQVVKCCNLWRPPISRMPPPLSLYKGETFVIMSLLHLIEPSFWPKQLSESLMTGLKAQK